MTMNTFHNGTYGEVKMKWSAYNESHKKGKDFNFTVSVYYPLQFWLSCFGIWFT